MEKVGWGWAGLVIVVLSFDCQADERSPGATAERHDDVAGHHHESAHHWMAPAKMAGRNNPVKSDKSSLARGKQLYERHCRICHGEQGQGDGAAASGMRPAPANLAVMAPLHSDGDLAWKIAEGRGAMPGWRAALRPMEIWDVVNFIKHLSKRCCRRR